MAIFHGKVMLDCERLHFGTAQVPDRAGPFPLLLSTAMSQLKHVSSLRETDQWRPWAILNSQQLTPLQNNIHLERRKKPLLTWHLRSRVLGSRRTKKVYAMDFIFASMLRFEVHMLGKSTGLPKKKQKMGFNIDFLLIFHVKGPKPQNRVNTA